MLFPSRFFALTCALFSLPRERVYTGEGLIHGFGIVHMESNTSFEAPVSVGSWGKESCEYSVDELEEIGNELQICIVLSEGSDMLSWIDKDSANFRFWLSSEDGQSALRAYLSEYPLGKIRSRGEHIIEQYEYPENLKSLIADDTALTAFIVAFRKAYPHATESAGVPDGQTIH